MVFIRDIFGRLLPIEGCLIEGLSVLLLHDLPNEACAERLWDFFAGSSLMRAAESFSSKFCMTSLMRHAM